MAIKDAILPEFDHEMATTRSLLERVPVDADWKPHAKSMTLGRLSAHVTELPYWGVTTMTTTELDFNPPGGQPYVSPTYQSTAQLVKLFDDNVAAARSAIAAASDADMMVNWSLKNGGQTVLTMPRVAVLRTFVMNHIIHHRAQLGVYLRLKDVPLPSTYGPSADAI
jgi:uncharacterized damage-inducible protein DinB